MVAMGWCRCFCVRWRSPIVGMVRTTVSTLCILVSSIQGFVLHEYHRPLGNVAAEVRFGAKSLRLEPSPSQRRRSGTTSSFSSGPMCRWGSGSTKMMMLDWESIVYNTESVANDMAGLSLQDPSNLVTSLPIMYGAGLLTSVSPCVWGLLPLTISYISTGAAERQDQKTTLPTLAFAAGLAVVFCTLGVTAAQLGEVFGAAESNNSGSGGSGIALLPLFSNSICFAMGLQLLGLVNLPLPSLDGILKSPGSGSLQPFRAGSSSEKELILIDGSGQILSNNQDTAGSNDKNNGSLFRTFLLGGSSALVASPCATPVLTSILAFVAKAQNPALGAVLLLGYTLGYSTPLLIIAGSGGQALVNLRQGTTGGGSGWYGRLAPWVTPITGGILLWYGTNGLLTALFGDPSMAGLVILE